MSYSAEVAPEIAVNRFGLGAHDDELSRVKGDPRGWLMAQVNGECVLPDSIRTLPNSADVFMTQLEAREERREAKQDVDGKAAADIAERYKKMVAPLYLNQVAARYQVAATTDAPFRERLVYFWSNHFAVSADKGAVLALAGTLENEAIRPNVQHHFIDMLLAVEQHPAMLLFLDNQASIGPNSRAALVAARHTKSDRKLGINENLGREILELHTLGVDGGYTQTDVTTFAQALTGWSVGGGKGRLQAGDPGRFVFRDNLHEPGAKTILGKRYAQEGEAQATAVLTDLARHPATAHHLATKLVRHFVADDPPAHAVERVAKAYRDSDGHLPTVYRTLIDLDEAWQPAPRKFKTPHEYAITTFRTLDFVPSKPQVIVASLESLGQRPFTPGSPAGWPDTASRWDGPDALMKRIEWASQIAQRVPARLAPLEIAQRSLGTSLSDHTRTAIANAADTAQALTLLLVSPDFMRR